MSADSSITFLIRGIPHQRPEWLQDRQVSPTATRASFQGGFRLLLVLPDSLSFALFLPLFPPFISLSPMNLITR